MKRWSDVRRATALRYPFMPFRGRMPLLQGSTDAIPEGLIVNTRHDIRVKVFRDYMYHDIYFWGDYEPYNTKIYRRLINAGSIVFDVGASFGWYTSLFAKWVDTAGKVHAFEPVPFIWDLALDTLRLNGVEERVELNACALGRVPGSATIHTYSGLPHGHATIADLPRDDAVNHLCRVDTLNEYCERHAVGVIDFMKVDVEGFEREVFAGGDRILASPDAPIIAFEINRDCLRARSLTTTDVVDELRRCGYSHFYCFSTRAGVRTLEPARFEDGDCIAGKDSHLPRLNRALKTGRLFR